MRLNQTVWSKLLTLSAIVLLASCSSNGGKMSRNSGASDVDPQKFGAVYQGRSYQQAILAPVNQVENKSAVINQGDFLAQLSNIHSYSGKLSSNFAPIYDKVTAWVLAGANVNELNNFGIHSQVMKGFDGYQNVLMTGYYSPVIHARRTQQGKYNQPIYALPSQKRFSRAEI